MLYYEGGTLKEGGWGNHSPKQPSHRKLNGGWPDKWQEDTVYEFNTF